MKRIFILLVIILLLAGCSKSQTTVNVDTSTQTDIVDNVEVEVEEVDTSHDGELLLESELYSYYLVVDVTNQTEGDTLSLMSGELSTNAEFTVRLDSVNLTTGESKTISEDYFNTYFNYEFEAQDKVFYSTENFSLNSETWHGAIFCLDQKTQTFAPVLSNTAVLLANTDEIAYFYDYTSNPILISLDLNTLQSKFLIDLPDLILSLDCQISGELSDDTLYIRAISSDIIISEIVFSIKESAYTLSENYKQINFFKTDGVFTAYDAETYEIYNVNDIIFDVYAEETLYTSTEYVDNSNLIISSSTATNLSPVFSTANEINDYVDSFLSEHLYSASFNTLSYSEFIISDSSRADNDDGSTTLTYNYIYKPTEHYAMLTNDCMEVENIDYQKGSFVVDAYYLINRYVIDTAYDIVSTYDNASADQRIVLYQTEDFVFESSRILEKYSETSSETYSTGEYIYGYLKSTLETLDLAQTSYNSFFLAEYGSKVFLTSTQAPVFHGYNCHKISYIDLTTNSFITLDPTVSIFAIQDSRAYYVDEYNNIGYFSFLSLAFNNIATYENSGSFSNGALGYIEDDTLYVKLISDSGTLNDYQAISLK
ncbi:MAG: lipoprotein [Clostridia bacterium]